MSTMVRFTTAFGIWVAPIEHVLEVSSSSLVQPLPAPARGVAGVIGHHDHVVPVLSTLGVGRRHVLILEWGATIVGLLVDEVTGVIQVGADAVGPAPAGQREALVEGTVREGEGLAYVLDVSQVVAAALTMETTS